MAKYAACPGVMARQLEQETVLLDTVSGAYFSLNETASFVWARLSVATSVDDLTDDLLEVSDVSAEEARQDVAELLDALQSRGLITVDP